MDVFLNPFHNIYSNESNKHIHAHTLRTTLKEKIKDSFFVFAGTVKTIDHDEPRYLGLFDYITLGIPFMVDYWVEKISNMESYTLLINPIDHLILVALCLVFNLIRYSLAAIFTLIALPIVLIIHAVSAIISNPLKERADTLPISSSIGRYLGDTRSLSELLVEKSLTYEELEIFYCSGLSSSGQKLQEPRLGFRTKKGAIDNGFSFFAPIDKEFINKNKASIEAILELNIGGLASKFFTIKSKEFKAHFPNENEEPLEEGLKISF